MHYTIVIILEWGSGVFGVNFVEITEEAYKDSFNNKNNFVESKESLPIVLSLHKENFTFKNVLFYHFNVFVPIRSGLFMIDSESVHCLMKRSTNSKKALR